MKIIDENKLMGSPQLFVNYEKDNDYSNKIRIILQTKIKKRANGQKILLLKKESNPFRNISKPKETKDFNEFYKVWNSIINQKIKRGEIEKIEFNSSDKKIKNLGYIAKNISEINSSDPRLLLLWNYNPKIEVNMWFKNQKVGTYLKSNFLNEFKNFDISKEDDWKNFLYFFPTTTNSEIKGLGWKTLVKEMNKINNENQEWDDYVRLKHIETLIKEMA